MPDDSLTKPKLSALQGSRSGAEFDFDDLTALFAAHGGGGLSAEVSADLALEIVLNEIVEQACLATGATGAAIMLVWNGEMVCRASHGVNAPELGAPMGSESGVTAECIRTRQVQRCDDAQADPRADAEASRSLGVRSVMIFPLLREGDLVGVLEVFSSQPGAFGNRDEVTLEALARRVVKNLERASETLLPSSSAAAYFTAASATEQNPPARPLPPIAAAEAEEDSRAGSARSLNIEDDVVPETPERSAGSGLDVVTWVLGIAVLVCAVLLGTLVGVRLGWRRATVVRAQATKSASGAELTAHKPAPNSAPNPAQDVVAENGAARTGGEPGTNALSASVSSGVGNTRAAGREKKDAEVPASAPAAGSKDPFPPEGSLLVYEDGKEVFRMPPPVEGKAAKATGANQTGAPSDAPSQEQRASGLEPAEIVELAPEVAEGSLLQRVEPEYPEEARQQRIQGAVVLEVRIGRDGAIERVKLLSGQPLLANAAIAAVKQWRFKPRLVKGQPVGMQTRVTLNFRMP
ncbi:MAG: TonB family protein [Candidatus Sulfotelmatobacter sp.]